MSSAQQRLPESGTSKTTAPTMELLGRIDQIALVENTLGAVASPKLVAGIVMLISQMQSQEQHPVSTLSITSGVGTFHSTATFHGGAWRGHELTHPFDEHRSIATYGEPPRHPMDQEEVFICIHNPFSHQHCHIYHLSVRVYYPHLHLQYTSNCHVRTCQSPLIHTPPLLQVSVDVRLLYSADHTLMLPSSFTGDATSRQSANGKKSVEEDKGSRTVAFQDSYDVLASPVSKDNRPKNYLQYLIGHQEDPHLKDRQR